MRLSVKQQGHKIFLSPLVMVLVEILELMMMMKVVKRDKLMKLSLKQQDHTIFCLTCNDGSAENDDDDDGDYDEYDKYNDNDLENNGYNDDDVEKDDDYDRVLGPTQEDHKIFVSPLVMVLAGISELKMMMLMMMKVVRLDQLMELSDS
jgi:hypothetical protein